MSAFHSVFYVSTYGTAITRCRTACCHVPTGGIFFPAIHAVGKVSFSLGEIFCGNHVCVFYFLLIRGSADLTYRTCKTRRFSAVVFFFNGVAVFVFFNFAATTLWNMIFRVFDVELPDISVFSFGIYVSASSTFDVTAVSVIMRRISWTFVKLIRNARTIFRGTFRISVVVVSYRFDLFNPCMLVSAGNAVYIYRNIARLPVRRRCGYVHRSAVHSVHRGNLIIANVRV